jgi:hypothetical protein
VLQNSIQRKHLVEFVDVSPFRFIHHDNDPGLWGITLQAIEKYVKITDIDACIIIAIAVEKFSDNVIRLLLF